MHKQLHAFNPKPIMEKRFGYLKYNTGRNSNIMWNYCSTVLLLRLNQGVVLIGNEPFIY